MTPAWRKKTDELLAAQKRLAAAERALRAYCKAENSQVRPTDFRTFDDLRLIVAVLKGDVAALAAELAEEPRRIGDQFIARRS